MLHLGNRSRCLPLSEFCIKELTRSIQTHKQKRYQRKLVHFSTCGKRVTSAALETIAGILSCNKTKIQEDMKNKQKAASRLLI